MKEMLRRFGSIIGRRTVEDGLSEEIRFHIEQQTEKYVRAGMKPSEARRKAMIRFGGVERIREQTRDEFRPALLEDFLRDLSYGVRVLGRAPGFVIVATVTLALGIGAATAVFSVVNGVLLVPLPYPDADRIVRVFQINSSGRVTNSVSEPNFNDWKTRTRAFRAMAVMATASAPVTIAGETSMILGTSVSREFFDVLGVHPVVGRGFRDDERRIGGPPVVIISDRLWRTRLAGAPVETLDLRSNDAVFQVVGVMPPGFSYPFESDYWYPSELSEPTGSRTAHNWLAIARLADGIPLERAIADLSAVSRAVKQEHGDGTWMSDATAVPLREQLTSTARPVLLLLFGASLVLLVIACLNVSNLQLARASARRREVAIRRALGAGRGRLARQLLAESFVLSALAAAAGLAIALLGVRALVALQPSNLPRITDVRVDLAALLFAIGIAVMTAMALGLATALRASKRDVSGALSDDSRTAAGSRASERVRHALVVAQVALTIVLLAGAGLLARSFLKAIAVDPGYHTENALLVELQWTNSREPGVQQRRKLLQEELLTRLRALPGVQQAGLVNDYPLGRGYFANGLFTEMSRIDELHSFEQIRKLFDDPRTAAEVKARQGFAGYRVASEGYFPAMGIRLVRGRLFQESDAADAPHVALISESLAAAQWPDRDPIGRFIQFGNMDGNLRGFRIVGIVSDVRENSPESVPGQLFYGYYKQRMTPRFTIVLRTDRAAALAPTVREVIRSVDPELPAEIRRVEDAFDRAFAGRRFSLTLIATFSIVALVLATLGIYGLIAYLVTERTREIGIRLALGAESRDVLRIVVGKGLALAVAGICLGLGSAMALTRFLEGMLFGVTSTDPVALGSVILVTLAAVVAASYIPARRAMRLAPVIALRSE